MYNTSFWRLLGSGEKKKIPRLLQFSLHYKTKKKKRETVGGGGERENMIKFRNLVINNNKKSKKVRFDDILNEDPSKVIYVFGRAYDRVYNTRERIRIASSIMNEQEKETISVHNQAVCLNLDDFDNNKKLVANGGMSYFVNHDVGVFYGKVKDITLMNIGSEDNCKAIYHYGYMFNSRVKNLFNYYFKDRNDYDKLTSAEEHMVEQVKVGYKWNASEKGIISDIILKRSLFSLGYTYNRYDKLDGMSYISNVKTHDVSFVRDPRYIRCMALMVNSHDNKKKSRRYMIYSSFSKIYNSMNTKPKVDKKLEGDAVIEKKKKKEETIISKDTKNKTESIDTVMKDTKASDSSLPVVDIKSVLSSKDVKVKNGALISLRDAYNATLKHLENANARLQRLVNSQRSPIMKNFKEYLKIKNKTVNTTTMDLVNKIVHTTIEESEPFVNLFGEMLEDVIGNKIIQKNTVGKTVGEKRENETELTKPDAKKRKLEMKKGVVAPPKESSTDTEKKVINSNETGDDDLMDVDNTNLQDLMLDQNNMLESNGLGIGSYF